MTTMMTTYQARIAFMDSKLAREAKRASLAANQKLSPEQRLNAFLAHSRLVVALFEAGKRLRAEARRSGG